MNKLAKIQEILFHEIQLLETGENLDEEIKRSNAISKGATGFIKSVDIQLKIKEMSINYGMAEDKILKETGIVEDNV